MIRILKNSIFKLLIVLLCVISNYSLNSNSMDQSRYEIPKNIKVASKLPNLYLANGGCDYLLTHYIPQWAPKNHWKIYCINNFGKNAGELDGETFPKENLILVKRDKNNEKIMKIILHEWTHASVSEYSLKRNNQWKKWTNYVNHIKEHKTGYYGLPEEVLAENVTRCSLGFEYLNTGYNIASCKVIHDLFPIFNTVNPKILINHNLS